MAVERLGGLALTGRRDTLGKNGHVFSSAKAPVLRFREEVKKSEPQATGINSVESFYQEHAGDFSALVAATNRLEQYNGELKDSELFNNGIQKIIDAIASLNGHFSDEYLAEYAQSLRDHLSEVFITAQPTEALKQAQKDPFTNAMRVYAVGGKLPSVDTREELVMTLFDELGEEAQPLWTAVDNYKHPLTEALLRRVATDVTFLKDFTQFMEDDAFSESREAMRPLLEFIITPDSDMLTPDLDQRTNGIDKAVQSLQAELKAQPAGPIYDKFLTRIMQKRVDESMAKQQPDSEPKLDPGTVLHQHLLLGLAMEAKRTGQRLESYVLDMTLSDVKRILPEIEAWLPDMKQKYFQLLASEIRMHRDTVMRQLREFTKTATGKSNGRSKPEKEVPVPNGKRKNLPENANKATELPLVEAQETEVEAFSFHSLAVVKRDKQNGIYLDDISAEDYERVIRKRSNQYGGNPITRQIIIDAVGELLKDPYRSGTEETIREVRLPDGSHFPLRSFSIKVGSNLGIPANLPKGVRVLYFVDRETRKVGLQGIGDHIWYERELDKFKKK
jgi:hypothetical protein